MEDWRMLVLHVFMAIGRRVHGMMVGHAAVQLVIFLRPISVVAAGRACRTDIHGHLANGARNRHEPEAARHASSEAPGRDFRSEVSWPRRSIARARGVESRKANKQRLTRKPTQRTVPSPLQTRPRRTNCERCAPRRRSLSPTFAPRLRYGSGLFAL